MNDNSIHPGAKRFAEAVALGHPIANTPAQAIELVEIENREAAATAGEIVAGSIVCRECGKVGPQGRMSSGALIPICAACKADADGAAEAQLRAACAAFNAAAKATCARIDADHERNQEYMSDGREGRDSFDRYCNEGDDE
jgi:hypothetical protein